MDDEEYCWRCDSCENLIRTYEPLEVPCDYCEIMKLYCHRCEASAISSGYCNMCN